MTQYTPDLQKLFLEMMMGDAHSFVRVSNIYNPTNFDQSLRATAKFLKEHSEKYKVLPTHAQVKAQTGVELKTHTDLGEDIKDVNAAVVRYGKLFTLKSIIDAKQTSRLKINLMRKRL